MNKIIEKKGDKQVQDPHMNQDMLERNNQLLLAHLVAPEASKYPLNVLID
jgi:hypothetical protein